MREWIRSVLTFFQGLVKKFHRFLVWLEWRFVPHPEDGPETVWEKTGDKMLVRVVAFDKRCGCEGYLVELTTLCEEGLTVGLFVEDNLDESAKLLTSAAKYIRKNASEPVPPAWLSKSK